MPAKVVANETAAILSRTNDRIGRYLTSAHGVLRTRPKGERRRIGACTTILAAWVVWARASAPESSNASSVASWQNAASLPVEN